MLAGTISTEKTLADFEKLLGTAGFQFETVEDEIFLQGPVNLTLRTGFGHEYIVVADSVDKEVLTIEVQLLSDLLKNSQIKHEFEFYDRANELYDVIEFMPVDQ